VAPRFSNQRVDALDIETIGTNVVLQFQPSEESEVWLDVSYGKAKKTQDIYQFQEKNWHRGADRPIAGSAIVDEDTQTYIFTLSERGVGFQQTRHRELEDETLATTLGGELIRGPWTFEARLNHHKLNADIPVWNQANFQSPIGAPASEVPLGFSCGVMVDPATNQPVESGGVVVGARDQCGILFGSWFDPINNPDGGPRLGQVRINGRNVNDETTSFFFDVDREVEFGPFSSIEFGIKYTDRNKDRFENNVGISVSNTESPPETQMPISAFSEPFPFSDPWLGGEAASGQVTNWPVPDLALIWAEIFPSGLPATSANPLNTWDITEEVSAAYLQANFQAMGGLLYGNIGLRWVDTQINANGTSGIQFRSPLPTYFEIELTDEYCDTIAGQVCNVETPVSEEHDYAELLPSFNLNYALREDMLLRFAASKTMARPQFDHLRPNGNLNIASFTESTFRGGNPLLKPLISTNLDVSWEWYYGDSNMLAAALFYKDIEDFTFASTFDRQYINPFTGECFQDEQVGTEGPWDCDEITTFANINGGKAEILGLELTYQQTLEHLSGWASGLGFLLNYTYADSEGDYDPATGADDPYDGFPFINTSEHTYNATAFWDGEKLQARLAYNWRTAYLITPQANDMATWADPTGSLDASFTFQINDNVALTGNAVNLTDEAPRLFQTVARSNRDTVVPEGNLFENSIYEGRTHQVNYYGRTYRLGVRVTF
jgi:TonB-dependent receptor